MKKFILKIVCRSRIVTTLIAYYQVSRWYRWFFEAYRQELAGQTELSQWPSMGVLAEVAVGIEPVRALVEWHPLRRLHGLWIATGTIASPARYHHLFEAGPDLEQARVALRCNKVLVRAFGATPLGDKIPADPSLKAGRCSWLSHLRKRHNRVNGRIPLS